MIKIFKDRIRLFCMWFLLKFGDCMVEDCRTGRHLNFYNGKFNSCMIAYEDDYYDELESVNLAEVL